MGILPWRSRSREGVQHFSSLITASGEVEHGRSSETEYKLARKFTLLSTVGSREKNVSTGFGLASVGAMC